MPVSVGSAQQKMLEGQFLNLTLGIVMEVDGTSCVEVDSTSCVVMKLFSLLSQ